MPTDDSRDPLRRAVDNMTSEEVAATLDQIAALTAATPPPDLIPARNQPIELPEPPTEVAALTVRIEVEHITPPVWRTVVVRGDLTLDVFHEVIQRAVGWENTHLHRFWARGGQEPWRGPYYVTDADLGEGDQGTHEKDARLDQVLRAVGDSLTYTYDFGDDWHHRIRLEEVGELADDAPLAVCTDGAMAGPLEDSGGPPGYQELVAGFSEDPHFAGLEDYVREWLPTGWDPTEFDRDHANTRLLLIGAAPEEIFTTLAGGVPPPESLTALLERAAPDVMVELTRLCHAAAETRAELTEDDVAAIARPYRLLLDLAGDEGIPLTQAGWMKPTVVRELFTALGLPDWMGKGTREQQTPPVAELRQNAQDLGLLRKHKGRLLRTRKAQQLSSDRDHVEFVAAGLLRDRDGYLAAARGLFTLLSVEHGGSHLNLADDVADLLTRCGLRTGPTGVERWHVIEMVRPTWHALDGESWRTRVELTQDSRAVGLARAALWPEWFADPGGSPRPTRPQR